MAPSNAGGASWIFLVLQAQAAIDVVAGGRALGRRDDGEQHVFRRVPGHPHAGYAGLLARTGLDAVFGGSLRVEPRGQVACGDHAAVKKDGVAGDRVAAFENDPFELSTFSFESDDLLSVAADPIRLEQARITLELFA